MNQYTVNENGLTYAQWYAAATLGANRPVPAYRNRRMRAAWRNGECPCDWAAYFQGVSA